MISVQITGVPEGTHAVLLERAARADQSLQEYLQAGYSPSTIAAEIAGLVAAGAIADRGSAYWCGRRTPPRSTRSSIAPTTEQVGGSASPRGSRLCGVTVIVVDAAVVAVGTSRDCGRRRFAREILSGVIFADGGMCALSSRHPTPSSTSRLSGPSPTVKRVAPDRRDHTPCRQRRT